MLGEFGFVWVKRLSSSNCHKAHGHYLPWGHVSLRVPPFVAVVLKAFSDSDLEDVVAGGYSPDKKKGKW